MGLFDSLKQLFGARPAAPREPPPAIDETVGCAPPYPELERAIGSGDQAAWQIYADWLLEQGISWGEVMAAALQGTPNTQRQEALERALFGVEPRKAVWHRGVMEQLTYIPQNENEPPMHEVVEKALRHPAGHFVRKLTLGLPPDAELKWHLEDLARALVNAGPLPRLTKLDMSVTSPAMDQISWRRVGDISCVWKAVPHLEELLLQGSAGSDGGVASRLAPIDAPHLERFVFTSGGLDQSVPLELGVAFLPALVHLELWLGVPNYGCSTTLASLEGILSGDRLPKLTSLALKNSEWESELIEAVAKSKVLPRLKALDFSMGVMSSGARAELLRHAEQFKHLEWIELSDNYFSAEDQRAIKAVLPRAVFGEQKPLVGDDDRYVSVAE